MREKKQIMAILNTTPDSLFGSVLSDFQDGEYERRLENMIRQMLQGGAEIIDVGGESTGPGSSDVSVEEEWGRIEVALQTLQKLRDEGLEFKISVDTYKAEVFEKALEYRVDMLNDVTGLRGDHRMIDLVASSGVTVCVMYSVISLNASGNEMRTNNEYVQYENVIKTIGDFLEERVELLLDAGMDPLKIILDPGMGSFLSGDPKYSLEVLDRLGELKSRFPRYRFLIGASRKGFTGIVFGNSGEVVKKLPVSKRLEGSLKAAKTALTNGADILRVHDVRKTRELIEASRVS